MATRAFKYDSTNGMTSLGVLTGGSYSYAQDVSSDGSVIVGYSDSTDGSRAFKYDSHQWYDQFRRINGWFI